MQYSTRLAFFGARLLGNCGTCRVVLTVPFSPTSCPAKSLSVFLLHVLYLLPIVASPISKIKSYLLHVMHAYHLSIIFVVTYTLYIIYFKINIIYFILQETFCESCTLFVRNNCFDINTLDISNIDDLIMYILCIRCS